MREIEIKVRITDPEGTLKKIMDAGIRLSEPKKQHDVVYGPPNANGREPDSIWLRLRTEDDAKVIFTLKKALAGSLDSIEHETTVDNADELTAIIEVLGYELFSDLTKVRRKAKYSEIELCFDELPGLGTFVEAELLCDDDADGEAVKQQLWEFMTMLGLDHKDEVTDGYDVLMREAQGLS